MMPIGVPRVPYKTPGEGGWQWVDLWNCLYRERIIFVGQARERTPLPCLLLARTFCALFGFFGRLHLREAYKQGCRVTEHRLRLRTASNPNCSSSTLLKPQGITEELGNQLVGTMLFLDSTNQKDMYLYINSMGGEVVPTLAIHDTIKHIRSDVGTVAFGGAMGMARERPMPPLSTRGHRSDAPTGDLRFSSPTT